MNNGQDSDANPDPSPRYDNTASTSDTSPDAEIQRESADTEQAATATVHESLLRLGFVNFDAGAVDNATSGAMVAAELRQHFRRDVYVGICDVEQHLEFFGRIVEGPFHSPHEVSQRFSDH